MGGYVIHLVYQQGWDEGLSHHGEGALFLALPSQSQFFDSNISLSKKAQYLIDLSLRTFDDDQSLKGFLAFSDCEKQGLTPFSVTSHYCVKVLSCSLQGDVQLSVSPIYHLGLDYPEVYQHQQGKELDPSAMLGLIEVVNHARSQEYPNGEQTCDGHLFCYGIDAGIAFNESPVPHNRSMSLQLSIFEDCVLATFMQNGQVSTQTLSWGADELSQEARAHDVLHIGHFPLQQVALVDSA